MRRKVFAEKKLFATMPVPAWQLMPESGYFRI